MAKVILHIDLNAFFAACEILENPSLKNKPIAISFNSNKSVISTSSYEARKYGVTSAMPVFMAKKKCKDLILIPPNFKLYQKKSEEFFSILKEYSPIMEIASIDECYMDITEPISKQKDPLKYIKSIQEDVLKRTGLGCSIGVAPNKFLAKMASDYQKPLGLTLIRKKDVPKMLWPLPIESMFGIGKKSAPKLIEKGINTIGDLATYQDIDTLRNILGKSYYTLQGWANGNGDDYVNCEDSEAKSIGTSTTLNENTTNIEYLSKVIEELSKSVSSRAKEEKLVGLSISLVYKDENFKTINRSSSLKHPINDKESISLEAIKLLEDNYMGDIPIRLVGVTLKNLKPESKKIEQLNLFSLPEEKEDKVNSIIEKINKKLGYEALLKASKYNKKRED